MKLKQCQNSFHVIENANSIVQLATQIKNEIMIHQCECKSYYTVQKDYSWNHSTCIVKMVSI